MQGARVLQALDVYCCHVACPLYENFVILPSVSLLHESCLLHAQGDWVAVVVRGLIDARVSLVALQDVPNQAALAALQLALQRADPQGAWDCMAVLFQLAEGHAPRDYQDGKKSDGK